MEKAKLIAIVGDANVSDSEDILRQYSRDMSFAPPVKPAMVVKPKDASQITEIVRLARETLTPLIPVSSGAPHFRGDTVPTTGGAVIVDLSGMKKVIHIDRRNRVAMFEPGVTFGELIPAVAEKGLRLNMPLLPRQTKSVTASMLEREPVLMPKYHWDAADPLSCTEIIFGTGDMFRTGSAAGSGTIEEQWSAGGCQKEAAGPSSVSWYRMIQGSQGTMGIVTWTSARCELIPILESSFFVGGRDLERVLELVHWLIRLRLVNECLVLNNVNLAMMTAGGDAAEFERRKNELPKWILFFTVAAYDFLPEERMRGQVEDMHELAQRVGVVPVKWLEGVSADAFLKTIQRPADGDYWKLRAGGGCEDIFFLANYDRIQNFADTMNETAEANGFAASNLGVYLQPVVQGVNCHCEFNLFYDAGNAGEVNRARNLSSSAISSLLQKGAYFSRPYGETTMQIMNRDAATKEALKKVKAIADPLEIMNPGKIFV